MISKYTRTMENGRKIDVFMSHNEHKDSYTVLMRKEPQVSVLPTTVKEVVGDVAHVLTDFLEDDKKLKQFEEGVTFALKLNKGKGFVL